MNPILLWRRLTGALRAWLRRDAHEADLDEELGTYLRMEAERRIAAGMTPDEAWSSARRDVGSVAALKEQVHDVGWEAIAESLLQDLRYAARLLLRRRGFTAVAVVALALGIGVNTAVFTAYRAMVARPLDARNPREMVNLALSHPGSLPSVAFSAPDYAALRAGVHTMGLVAFSLERFTISGIGGRVSEREGISSSQPGRLGVLSSGTTNAELATTFAVSDNYFGVLGIPPARGRVFDAMTEADRRDVAPVLVSENYWQRRMAGDESVLGRVVHLGGIPVTIVGITPRDVVGTSIAVPDFWVPLSLEPLLHGDDRWLVDRENARYRLFGRLAPGATIDQAQAEVASVTEQLRALHDPKADAAKPATPLVWPGSPFPFPLSAYRGLTFTIVLIMAAAAMVLIVACANVGSLQVARAKARQVELQTRLSLGASRLRLARQMLTESALLGLISGATALVFSWAFLRVMVTVAANALPVEFGALVFDVTPDPAIFAYVFAMSMVAAVLFGLAPALESSREAQPSSARSATASAHSRRLQDVLVAVQVALSFVLLASGSLLIDSARHSLQADPGYEAGRAVEVEFHFPESAKYSTNRQIALASELRDRLSALPGVEAVTSARPPEDNFLRATVVSDPGATPGSPARTLLAYRYVQANYFQTLGIPLTTGRSFSRNPDDDARAVIVSASAARQFWPGASALGHSLRLARTGDTVPKADAILPDLAEYRVIGIARDTRGVNFDGTDARLIYLPLAAARVADHPLLIRTTSDPGEVVRLVDPIVASVDADLLGSASTFQDLIHQSSPFIVSSLSAGVASAVGLVGLLLASMGIHGTVAYIAVLRTREVGIRMAIGATRRDIVLLMLTETTRPVVAGVMVGGCLAAAVFYLLRGILYGVNSMDIASLGGVAALLVGVALAAAYGPSRRASVIEPVVALRTE